MSAFAFLGLAAAIASERVEIKNGKLPAPGAARCVRLHATGTFQNAQVRVNDFAAGDLRDQDSELDITGYLSTGAPNAIKIRAADGVVDRVWAWLSPLVYIASAKLANGQLEVTIANTTENTAQIEIGDHHFTVSPGTSATRQLRWTGSKQIKMHAVSDGLDREFIDEIEASAVEPR